MATVIDGTGAPEKQAQNPRGRTRPGPRRPRRNRGNRVAYLLVAPAVIVLLAVLAYPIGRLIVLSFQSFDSRSLFTGDAPFVGVSNYTEVLSDPEFWTVVGRTVVVVVAVVAIMMTLGFALASLLTRVSPWARVTLMVCLVLVWAMPMVSAALVWQWLFQPQYGVMNWLLTQGRVFGDLSAHDWFSHPEQGMSLIIALIIWKGLPFVVLTMYAALGQIPGELYEAAGLDGAGRRQTLRYVTVPMMRPVLAILVVLEVIWSVNSFTPIWVLTQGGPSGETSTLSVYSYVSAFTANDYGKGAAISLITIALLAAFAVLHVRRLAKDGEVA
ncbi:sugar ABC transporter permease [Streptomyces sp. AD681]|uniref:carbohydrate ABC transporter permease n=1 Tax=Streptomyces sp. AD681 TaxID=3019069 RepID=UPI0022F1462A|nr:sugar ABC transporter permease [Streptomyces sp. AD681]MDA5147527.1 sugar ABC transporter permease [Streptomyces sp. AD681]